jgi:hypothetical protein
MIGGIPRERSDGPVSKLVCGGAWHFLGAVWVVDLWDRRVRSASRCAWEGPAMRRRVVPRLLHAGEAAVSFLMQNVMPQPSRPAPPV